MLFQHTEVIENQKSYTYNSAQNCRVKNRLEGDFIKEENNSENNRENYKEQDAFQILF